MQSSMQPGMQQGMQQGMQPGIQLGMQQGMQQGMQPGMQQGMQPGMQHMPMQQIIPGAYPGDQYLIQYSGYVQYQYKSASGAKSLPQELLIRF